MMKMRLVTIIVLSLISIQLFTQFDKFCIEFHPSFLAGSKLQIEKEDDGYTMHFQSNEINQKCAVPDSFAVVLEDFLSSYQCAKKTMIDTILHKSVLQNGDTIIEREICFGNDGITVNGVIQLAEKIKSFQFWSPRKNDKNHELVALLFSLMSNSFTDTATVIYQERLEQYFDFGLGLKKIKDKPLQYKLYGSITEDKGEQLRSFFEKLPKNKLVYIDMSNFEGMGTMFEDDFLDVTETHKHLFWIKCSPIAKKMLERAEIASNRIQ
ncbi:hypothetical protein [Paludibacter sp.]|uniref:hypothetical protein n=1 Tax=Paludibacter sp. TaxID=1898105 RepID=UPI00135512C1|nr:hypothetical protein [Paludibacter sp.]MTK53554.1 hypothetical protein [Paludibacter sp.]